MARLEKSSIGSYMTFPVFIALIFTMFINGQNLIFGGKLALLKYLNIYNSIPADAYPAYFEILFYIIGVLQLGAALMLCYALVKREYLLNRSSSFLKWGILLSIISIMLFGFMVRIVSNHGGAANLYFYLSILYFLLWYTEQRSSENGSTLFNKIKLLPIYATVFYTMGFPGWQKIANTSDVMGKYVSMFSGTFLAKLPGGVEPFIYLLGSLEIAVPVLLIISIVKKELSLKKYPVFFNIALLISISTFTMLAFGLSILINYPGATNLVFYTMLTFWLYTYVSATQIKINEKLIKTAE